MIHFSHGDNTIVVNLDPTHITAVVHHNSTVVGPLTSPLTILLREYIDVIEFRSIRPEGQVIGDDLIRIYPEIIADHVSIFDALRGSLDMIMLCPNDTATWRPE